MLARRSSRLIHAVSPNVAAGAFGLDVWVSGNPIVADAGPPNSNAPAANRILTVNAYARNSIQVMGAGAVRAFAIGGTSVTYQAWFYDTTLATWVPWGIARTITVATTNLDTAGNSTAGAMVGAQFFCQITAVNNTGSNVTNFGYAYL